MTENMIARRNNVQFSGRKARKDKTFATVDAGVEGIGSLQKMIRTFSSVGRATDS